MRKDDDPASTPFWTRLTLKRDDLLRDVVYRRLWMSVLTSAFGMQIMILALPLTAAVSLRASPTQMGRLTMMGILPFVLFSLPTGVWLDRVRKLPVYITGEVTLACAAASIPLAWWNGMLSMDWLCVVAFMIGIVNTTAGSASQIVLTQIVPRDRLIEANAKNAFATSVAEVAGPGFAGALIKLLGAPIALLFNAALLLLSAAVLRGIRIDEPPPSAGASFWSSLKAGVSFVFASRLLTGLGCYVAGWQLCYNSALVVNILFAARILEISPRDIGFSYVCLGIGTVCASLTGAEIGRRIGPASCLTLGFGVCTCSWLMLAIAPAGAWGIAMFPSSLTFLGFGEVLIFVNFISLRQAATPAFMLGRMTSTMRWMILIPAGPGALIGGWLGEHAGLRMSLGFAGIGGVLLTLASWRSPLLRTARAFDGSKRPA